MSRESFSWLSKYSRPIAVSGKKIKVLYSPKEYFEALKDGIQKARKRVVFSSLYLGTGHHEQELVDAFTTTLSDSARPGVNCTLLLDHLRGSRGHPNSRTMVQNLVNSFGDRFKLHLYHTPNLRGVLRHYGPERFNEVMGLQHMKIYIWDNDLMISGANMSRDYFVDRQDRYIVFKDCPQVADFFADIIHATAHHSFTLNTRGSTDTPSAIERDPLSSRTAASEFRTSLKRAVERITLTNNSFKHGTDTISGSDGNDTLVYPLIQMGHYGIRQDEVVSRKLLEELKADEELYLASGYFNLPSQYIKAILDARGEYNILAASPQANGFYGASGVAGHVPFMYIHFARNFLEEIASSGNEERVRYYEYLKEGWTFHGKGLWFYQSGEDLPALTLMGSSNYGYRSLSRDLEAQIAVVTSNTDLRTALHEEQQRMFECGRRVDLSSAKRDPSRRLNFLQWLATSILKPHV